MGGRTSQNHLQYIFFVLAFILLRTLFALVWDVTHVGAENDCYPYADRVVLQKGSKDLGHANCGPDNKYAVVGYKPDSFIILDMGIGNEITNQPGADLIYYSKLNDEGFVAPVEISASSSYSDDHSDNFKVIYSSNAETSKDIIYIDLPNADLENAYRFIRIQPLSGEANDSDANLVYVDAIQNAHPRNIRPTPTLEIPTVQPPLPDTPTETPGAVITSIPTDTPIETIPFTQTEVGQGTPTFTPTPTPPPSATSTRDLSPIPPVTSTPTDDIYSYTQTATSTLTDVAIPTNTHSPAITFTPTGKYTNTHTPTATTSPDPTSTSVPTSTSTSTSTDTPTNALPPTATPTKVQSKTKTPTASKAAILTPTHTPARTKPFTATVTASPTKRQTSTYTPTLTKTPTASPTVTATAMTGKTPTVTRTISSNVTPTVTATLVMEPESPDHFSSWSLLDAIEKFFNSLDDRVATIVAVLTSIFAAMIWDFIKWCTPHIWKYSLLLGPYLYIAIKWIGHFILISTKWLYLTLKQAGSLIKVGARWLGDTLTLGWLLDHWQALMEWFRNFF